MPIIRRLSCFYLSAMSAGCAAAHSGDSPSDPLFLFAWQANAWIMAGVAVSAWLYGSGIRQLWAGSHRGAGMPRWRVVCYAAGLTVLIVALVSPVDALGAELFSMHMVQHELLMLAAAPLLVAGRPLAAFVWAFPFGMRQRIGRLVKRSVIRISWHALTAPFAAWSLHAAILWAWHFPGPFQAGLEDDTVHAAQHLSFLVSALLFWSSLMGSPSRLRCGAAVLYLLTTAIHTGILGALLTFSTHAWYPAYAGRTGAWGLTPLEDQQLGGLIMWVPAGFVFVLAGLMLAARAIDPAGVARRAAGWR